MTSSRITKKLADYQPSNFRVSTLDLTFELAANNTKVTAVSKFEKISQGNLVLDGQHLELSSVLVNGQDWQDYEVDTEQLVLRNLPAEFTLEIVTQFSPADNTALEGLYLSDGAYCTQCEAEGFRRITYFLDRPDVMAIYTTHIIAEPSIKHLLSNGNLISDTLLADGRRKVSWHDPFPKPMLFICASGR